MTSGSETAPSRVPPAASTSPPPEKNHISFTDYFLKDFLKSLLASMAGYIATFIALNSVERLKPFATPIGFIVGAAVGFFTSFGGWGKSEEKRLGVENILNLASPDSPTNPQPLLERNGHIQQEIQKIIAAGPPVNHQEALTNASHSQQVAR